MLYSSLFITVVCATTLLVFNHYNQYKNIERWYFRRHRWLYILLEIAYYLLVISLVFNGRFLVYTLIEAGIKYKYGLRINLYPYNK
jgi:hypothetical protein